jgi:3-oxoacyl-[acyl-carrier protein] reductase
MSQVSDNDKVALVTGASRGIGAAVVTRLAADGFAVVVNYASGRAGAAALVQRIADAGGLAIAIQADVGDAAAVRGLFDDAERTIGGVDVLVNCAGAMQLAPIAELDDAAFDRMVDVNLMGTLRMLREAARRLRRNGRIINFSSSVLGLQLPGYAGYAASKAGVEAFTAILAKELRGRNITVNTVAPGPIATDLFLHGKSAEAIARLAAQPPLERLGTPDDIARVVSFLAGSDGGWINGQTVRANGGIV